MQGLETSTRGPPPPPPLLLSPPALPPLGSVRQVPMPRAALKDLANSRGLARAAAEAQAAAESGDGSKPDRGGGGGAGAGYDETGGVELWADWPFSCVRLRGDPATVRRAVCFALLASVSCRACVRVLIRGDDAGLVRCDSPPPSVCRTYCCV